jgi:phage-related holin
MKNNVTNVQYYTVYQFNHDGRSILMLILASKLHVHIAMINNTKMVKLNKKYEHPFYGRQVVIKVNINMCQNKIKISSQSGTAEQQICMYYITYNNLNFALSIDKHKLQFCTYSDLYKLEFCHSRKLAKTTILH